jgi:hypothetical protein
MPEHPLVLDRFLIGHIFGRELVPRWHQYVHNKDKQTKLYVVESNSDGTASARTYTSGLGRGDKAIREIVG